MDMTYRQYRKARYADIRRENPDIATDDPGLAMCLAGTAQEWIAALAASPRETEIRRAVARSLAERIGPREAMRTLRHVANAEQVGRWLL
jgi:hypothetical protein